MYCCLPAWPFRIYTEKNDIVSYPAAACVVWLFRIRTDKTARLQMYVIRMDFSHVRTIQSKYIGFQNYLLQCSAHGLPIVPDCGACLGLLGKFWTVLHHCRYSLHSSHNFAVCQLQTSNDGPELPKVACPGLQVDEEALNDATLLS